MADETSQAVKTLNKILPAAMRQKAEDRISICNSCDKLNQSTRKCLMCGCFMDVKVFLPGVQCPLKKW